MNLFNRQILEQVAKDGRTYPELAKRMASVLLTNTGEKDQWPNELSEKEKDEAREIASLLVHAFPWASTPQGEHYWNTVYNELLKLRNT